MDDLLMNDASYEVYSNSDGARILANNRLLLNYPDEKNSFDVFMGVDGVYTFPFKTEAEGNTFRAWVIAKDSKYAKSIDLSATGKLNNYVQKAWDKYGAEYTKLFPPATTSTTKDKIFSQENIQKGAMLVSSTVQSGQAVSSAVQSFRTPEKKAIKEKCGRRPIFKKKRKTYDACVKQYMAQFNAGAGTGAGGDGGGDGGGITRGTGGDGGGGDLPPKSNTKTYIIIGVVAVALIGGFIYLKKTGKI
jgi:hypothetical protein